MADLSKFQDAFIALTKHQAMQVEMVEKHKAEVKSFENIETALRKGMQEHCPHHKTETRGEYDYYAKVDERFHYCTLCNKNLGRV